MKHTALYLAMTLCLAACSDDVTMPSVQDEPQGLPITLGAGYQLQSRVSDTGFNDADRMGIYIVDFVNGEHGSLSGSRHADNVLYTYEESTNKWTGATTLYWTPNTSADFYGYYPFDDNIGNPTAYDFTVEQKQNVAATSATRSSYERSDLLWAKTLSVAPTDQMVMLTYKHALAGVTIKLVEGDGFSSGEFEAAQKLVWVDNIRPSATVNLETQEISGVSGSAQRITPLEYNGTYRAIVPPQTVAAGDALVTLTIDGQNKALVKTASSTYQSGKMHTITLTIDKNAATGDYQVSLTNETIAPWKDDEEFHEGIIRQFVVVNVPTPGTLAQEIAKAGYKIAEISNLKITGTVNCDDFTYINDNQQILQNLNLYDVLIDNEDDNMDNVISGLGNCKLLNHIIFPKKLRGIDNWAFAYCSLTGSLIIPEGVEYIGEWSFAFNGYLNGEISLPSTLTEIGDVAFQFCPFHGSLILPEGITKLGSGVFSNANFTGSLSLPESLLSIGGGKVFGNSKFEGDLVIPQGTKKISGAAFRGSSFTGNLILPEGLEEIESQAFGNDWDGESSGFKGELKLPSTVKSIGAAAFGYDNFTSIIWPENLITLGNGVFLGNRRLSGTVSIPKNISVVPSRLFEDCPLITGIELHEDIEYIGENAFYGCAYLNSIVCKSEEPPYISETTFEGVSRNNFTVEVPAASVNKYKNHKRWGEFKRIAAYSNFVCRPSTACALNAARSQVITLNADGPWSVSETPSWCVVSPTSGTGKSQVTISFSALGSGAGDREGSVVFALDGTSFTAECVLSQYDYEYADDQIVTLQAHTEGNGIKVVMLGDGWNGADLSSGAFIDQCQRDMKYFFGLPPYDRLRSYFDVYAVVSLSQESGINTEYTYRDTRFGSMYGFNSGNSGCCCSTSTNAILPDADLIFDYLVDDLDFDSEDLVRGLTILIPNCSDYSSVTYYVPYIEWQGKYYGLSICPPSTNPYPYDNRGVIQHEAGGHGFGRLAEESVSKNAYAPSGVKSQIAQMQSLGWWKNVSTSGKMADVAWSDLIFDPCYSDAVDIYEGGCEYSRGVFRSELNSCMTGYMPYYNAISRMLITKRILEAAGTSFDLDDFFANDSASWGPTE